MLGDVILAADAEFLERHRDLLEEIQAVRTGS